MINVLTIFLITICLVMLISIILLVFWLSKIQNNYDKWWKKKENYLITLGVIIVIIAVFMPFIIMEVNNFSYSLITFEDLGPVGDYFGGTTVGLLTLSSLIFVASAMFMQKQELELQRKEIEKNRKEYQITNSTMKKQSFDSTFFNMIDLYQSVLENIRYGDSNGKKALEILFQEFYLGYDKWLINNAKTILISSDIDSTGDNVKEVINYVKEIDEVRLNVITNHHFNQDFESFYVANMDNSVMLHQLIVLLDRAKLIHWEYFMFYKEFKKNTPIIFRKKYYERFYGKYENLMGHYFRNLYRIMKYIQEYEFSNDDSINCKEKRNYRGILRAQLSSAELLLVFYNVCYSEKAEEFRKILLKTDFFDNHLITSNFIWDDEIKNVSQFK